MWSQFAGEWIENTYYLSKLLGYGSFGGVFLAAHVVGGRVLRNVAVKLIEVDPEHGDLQLNEVLHATALDHVHLLRCYHAGRVALKRHELLYMVLELAEGTLERALQSRCLDSKEWSGVVRHIGGALLYLHSQSIVHRDVKPANILWVKGEWKLSDLGTLRPLGNVSTIVTNTIFGSLLYMPPEALQGVVSPGWDIWSFGITMLMTVSRERPYSATSEVALSLEISSRGPLVPAGLPDHIDKVIRGCLTIDRSARWTAQRLLDALETPSGRTPQRALGGASNIGLTANPAQELYLRAIQLSRDGRLDEALSCISGAIDSAPDQPAFRLFRANAYFRTGDHASAAADFSACIDISDWDETSLTNALDCAIALHRPGWALPLIERNLKHRAASAPLLLRRGHLYMISDEWPLAARSYAQAQWLDLDNDEAAVKLEEISPDERRIRADERRFAVCLASDRIVVSVWDVGRPQVVEIEDMGWVPAAVGVSAGGDWVVGNEAQALAESRPENVALGFLGALGQPYDATIGTATGRAVRLRRGRYGDAWLDLGQGLPPEAALAMLLRVATDAIAKRWRARPLRCVVSIPPSSAVQQVAALRDAVEIAGLLLSATVIEPIASFAWLTHSIGGSGWVAFVDAQGAAMSVLVAEVLESAVVLRSVERESPDEVSSGKQAVLARLVRLLAKVEASSGSPKVDHLFVRTLDGEISAFVGRVFNKEPRLITEQDLEAKGAALLAAAGSKRGQSDRLYRGFVSETGAVPPGGCGAMDLDGQGDPAPVARPAVDVRWKRRARKALMFLPINGKSDH